MIHYDVEIYTSQKDNSTVRIYNRGEESREKLEGNDAMQSRLFNVVWTEY